MTRDDLYQVTYECSMCQKTHSENDTSMARIADTFEKMGWHNVPTPGLRGKIDYVVFCPRCYKKGQSFYDEDHAAHMEELDSQDMERQGLWGA